MLKKVFISREVGTDSIFRQLLEQNGFIVSGESLIDFKKIFQVHTTPIDWVFFYSKSGVKYFGHHPFLPCKIAVMGPGTAKAAVKIGYNLDFIGAGSPDNVAENFKSIAQGQSVLFPQGKNSKQSIQKKLNGIIKDKSLIVYSNKSRLETNQITSDIIVFTSPLNVQSYFKHNKPLPFQKLIAIGETTRQMLTSFPSINTEILTPEEPNEKKLAELIINF